MKKTPVISAAVVSIIVCLLASCGGEGRKTVLEGAPVDLKTISEESLSLFGIETPPLYYHATAYDRLEYDALQAQIGFKTTRDLPDTLELLVRLPGRPDQRGALARVPSPENEIGDGFKTGEKIYDCAFQAHLVYPAGTWRFIVSGPAGVVFSQEMKMEPAWFFLADEKTPSLFTTIGRYSVKPGDLYYLRYRCPDPADARLTVYYWTDRPAPAGQAGNALEPVFSVTPPVENGVAKTILRVGNDLKPGTYKFSAGKKDAVLIGLGADLTYRP